MGTDGSHRAGRSRPSSASSTRGICLSRRSYRISYGKWYQSKWSGSYYLQRSMTRRTPTCAYQLPMVSSRSLLFPLSGISYLRPASAAFVFIDPNVTRPAAGGDNWYRKASHFLSQGGTFLYPCPRLDERTERLTVQATRVPQAADNGDRIRRPGAMSRHRVPGLPVDM